MVTQTDRQMWKTHNVAISKNHTTNFNSEYISENHNRKATGLLYYFITKIKWSTDREQIFIGKKQLRA